jgi:hypothetical protein
MQRQFSSRGEALAEVTAARMLAGGKRSILAKSVARFGRLARPEKWFTKPAETSQKAKKEQPKRHDDMPPLM